MELLDKAEDIYRERGAIAVLAGLWIFTLQHSPASRPVKSVLGDEFAEKLIAAPELGYWPQIDNPQTFSEKVLYRKLRTDEPAFVTVADKWAVREYVAERAGEEVLNEVYHVTNDPETIPFDELPDKYVIKATHGSGMNAIVRGPDDEDRKRIKAQCRDWLSQRFGEETGEYWYTRIEPRIIVEEFLDPEARVRDVPVDYKFYVFDGRVEYIHVDFGRYAHHTRTFFDREWTPQEFTLKFDRGPIMDEPYDFDEMVDLAETIAQDFDFMRVDLYNPREGVVRFGEMTVAPEAGQVGFDPIEADVMFGELWPRVQGK